MSGQLTNRLNLPQPIFQAVQRDTYSRGDAEISVSDLLSPPRKFTLEERHDSEIVEDASDRIFSLIGQSIHTILERADKTGVAERRLYTDVDGVKVSGQVDRYIDGLVQDYKVQTLYRFKGGTVPVEIIQQLNCYAELLRANGYAVTQLQCVAILRDWSKAKARYEAGYPETQVIVRDVPLWEASQARRFMIERVRAIKAARQTLPLCSDEDRWASPPIFAVMKPGRKSAVRLHADRASAERHVIELGQGHYLQVRIGESKRCNAYCSASPFCDQFKEIEKENLGVSDPPIAGAE